jgi:DNA-binding GntR family transcriptional regulator
MKRTSHPAHAVQPPQRDVAASLHAQISHSIRERIVSGQWPPNYRLPPEPDLAKQLGVSRGTLRRALETLIGEGALRQVVGRGTFVISTVIEPAIAQKLSTLSEDFAAQGILTTTAVLDLAVVEAHTTVASLLDVVPGQGVLRLARLRSTVSGPLVLLHNYVRLDLAPGLERIDFTSVSLFGALEQRFGLRIGSGRRTFSAEGATDEVALALQLKRGVPVQYMEQVTYLGDGRPIEYSDIWINSRLLRVTSLLLRQ